MDGRKVFWLVTIVVCSVAPVLVPAAGAASPSSSPSLGARPTPTPTPPTTTGADIYTASGKDCRSQEVNWGAGGGRKVLFDRPGGNSAVVAKLAGDKHPEADRSNVSEIRAIYSPDGKTIAISDGLDVGLWNARTVRTTPPLPPMTVLSDARGLRLPVFSPDSRRVSVIVGNDQIRVYETTTFKAVSTLAVPAAVLAGRKAAGSVGALAYSPDGRFVAAARGPIIFLLDSNTGREVKRFKAQPVKKSVDADGYAWGHSDDVSALRFSPNVQALLSTSATSVRLWDLASGKQLRCMAEWDSPVYTAAEFSPDGRRLAVYGSRSQGIELVNALTFERLPQIFLQGPEEDPTSVAFSPDGRTLLATRRDETAQVLDAQTGALLGLMRLPAGVHAGSFSPDGRRAVTAFEDVSGGASQPSWSEVAWVWDVRHKNLALAAAAAKLEEEGWWLDLPEAANKYRQAAALNPDKDFSVPAVARLYDFCREGAYRNQAELVLPFCNQAVKYSKDLAVRESRGVARALVSDIKGAIDDFNYCVDHWAEFAHEGDEDLRPQWRSWIQSLQQRRNPFDGATLERLRYR